jgi:hypothetical protein
MKYWRDREGLVTYIPLNLARIFYGGFSIKDSDPLILVRADNVYLITHSRDDKAAEKHYTGLVKEGKMQSMEST